MTELLDAAAQAARLGITPSHLAVLKRTYGPRGRYSWAPYPTHDPNVVVRIGQSDCIPAAALDRWDALRPGKGTAGRTGRPPTQALPDVTLTRTQQTALRALAAGQTPTRGHRALADLRGYRLVSLSRGGQWQVTALGRRYLRDRLGAGA
jgi:hypothetical protein